MVMRCGLLLALTGCSVSSPVEFALPSPPVLLTAACPSLQSNPGRALSQAEVEVMWGRDRTAGRACAARHGALVEWVEGLVATVGAQ